MLRVVELFAGVGGFRIGLEGWQGKSSTSGYTKKLNAHYQTVWCNQWEPGTKSQAASSIYIERFGQKGHANEDIEKIIEHDFESIPDHDLLVGGFPCQDYSVARTLSQAKGLIGEKGVLWWSIYTILKRKGAAAPKYLMLENVDRLLKSPASQRGKDFAIMLASLSDLGYAVEWRVINAADYGFPQRRRRVFILGYKKGTSMYKKIKEAQDLSTVLLKDGVAPDAFPVTPEGLVHEVELKGSLEKLTDNFSIQHPKASPFRNSGVMLDRKVVTMKVNPVYAGKRIVLGDLVLDERGVPKEFFLSDDDMPKWLHQKGGKKEMRTTKQGFSYQYAEGAMVFPDPLDKPSRTIVTGEGGSTPSRFKHVIMTKSGKLRRLTPLELERLNMFPDGHTVLDGVSDVKRAFIMGNALVVGVIEGLGKALLRKM